MEKSVSIQFSRVLDDPEFSYAMPEKEQVNNFALRVELSGESSENILKICHLVKHYPDISLFIQANPAFCCAGIVTEAMKSSIEELVDISIVSITYDGTGGNKNEVVIPYLKFPRVKKSLNPDKEDKITI